VCARERTSIAGGVLCTIAIASLHSTRPCIVATAAVLIKARRALRTACTGRNANRRQLPTRAKGANPARTFLHLRFDRPREVLLVHFQSQGLASIEGVGEELCVRRGGVQQLSSHRNEQR
jgi:hypothetical protein